MTCTDDMKLLARFVLDRDDATAACALADLVIENATSKSQRLTNGYVESLEDTLHQFKKTLVKNMVTGNSYDHQLLPGDVLIYSSTVQTLLSTYFKLERWAKSLNRQGLS